MDHEPALAGVIIPPDRLSPDALEGVIDDFIVREGTDYGHRDVTLEEKRHRVRRELATGRARIVYDPVTHTTTLVAASTLIG